MEYICPWCGQKVGVTSKSEEKQENTQQYGKISAHEGNGCYRLLSVFSSGEATPILDNDYLGLARMLLPKMPEEKLAKVVEEDLEWLQSQRELSAS